MVAPTVAQGVTIVIFLALDALFQLYLGPKIFTA